MKKRFNKLSSLVSLLVMIMMMLTGVTTMLPMYHVTRDKAILFFLLLWVGILVISMVRVIISMVKSNKEALNDMEEYYRQQEETAAAEEIPPFTAAPPTLSQKKKGYKAQISNAVTMMVLGSIVIVPALILSRHIFVLLFAFAWYGLLAYSIVQNVNQMKKAENDPTDDLQQLAQDHYEPPAMQRPADMTICPHCHKEVPGALDYCCYCRQKIR